MASLTITSLSEVLNPIEIGELKLKLLELSGKQKLDSTGEDLGIEHQLDEEIFLEFFENLAEEHVTADIYIPGSFMEILHIGVHKICSLEALLHGLESLQTELNISDFDDYEELEPDFDADDEDLEGFVSDYELVDEDIQSCWHIFYKSANEAIENNTNIIIKMD
jgi:hypothetical protein